MSYRLAALAALCCALPTTARAYEAWEDLEDAPRMKNSDPTSASSTAGKVGRETPALIYSAAPSGKGHTTISLGARASFLVPSMLPAPAQKGFPGARFELNVVYGLHELLDLEVRIGSILSQTDGEVGVRAHLVGNLDLALSAHLDVMFLNYWSAGERGEVGFWFGTNQGLTLSTGTRNYQVSLSFDIPLYFVGATSDGVGFGANLAYRPGVAIEVPIARVVTFSAQAGAILAPNAKMYLPTLALAMAW